MTDRRITHADIPSVEKDHAGMPQAKPLPRAGHKQPMDEPKVLETVTKRDIMEKLSLMMNQFDQNFQALNKQLEQMELRTVRTIESLSPTNGTQWKEEVLEETSKEAVLHEFDDQSDDKTNVYHDEEAFEYDADKYNELKEIPEESISNIDDSDQNDEEENTLDLDEAIQNDTDKDQDDENAYDYENITRASVGSIAIAQYLSDDKFQDALDSKNVQ